MDLIKDIKQVLTTSLFNREVLSLPNVTNVEIAKAAGLVHPEIDKDGNLVRGKTVDKRQVSRWRLKLRLDKSSIKNGVEPLSPETVGEWLVGNLSGEHLINLYEWAKNEHFERQINGPRPVRNYLPEKQAAKREEEKRNKEAAIERNKVAMTSDFFDAFDSSFDSSAAKPAKKTANKKKNTKPTANAASEDQKLRVEYVQEDQDGKPKFAYYTGDYEVTPGILGARDLVDQGIVSEKDLDAVAMALFMSDLDVSNPKQPKLLIDLDNANAQQQMIISLLEYGAEANNPHDWTTHYVVESFLNDEQKKLFSKCWITKQKHSGDDYVDKLLTAKRKWDKYEQEQSRKEMEAERKDFSLTLTNPDSKPNGKRNWIIVNRSENKKNRKGK